MVVARGSIFFPVHFREGKQKRKLLEKNKGFPCGNPLQKYALEISALAELRSLECINVLFGTFLRFAPKSSRNKRFSDVFSQRINVVRTTTKMVSVSYLFLADGIPGLSTATSNQEAVFESPQTQIHYWRTQQWKNTSTIRITVFGMNCKVIITSLL